MHYWIHVNPMPYLTWLLPYILPFHWWLLGVVTVMQITDVELLARFLWNSLLLFFECECSAVRWLDVLCMMTYGDLLMMHNWKCFIVVGLLWGMMEMYGLACRMLFCHDCFVVGLIVLLSLMSCICCYRLLSFVHGYLWLSRMTHMLWLVCVALWSIRLLLPWQFRIYLCRMLTGLHYDACSVSWTIRHLFWSTCWIIMDSVWCYCGLICDL